MMSRSQAVSVSTYPMVTADDDLFNALSIAYRWYGNTLPFKVGGPEFMRFVVRSHELARRIAPNSVMSVDGRAVAASTDGRNIWIPATYFMPEFFMELGVGREDVVAAAVVCINGSQIHEAIHCVKTTCNMVDAVKLLPAAEERAVKSRGFFAILNIVEDVFIEEWLRETEPGLSKFVDAKNEIMFSERSFQESLDLLVPQLQDDGTMKVATQDELLALISHRKRVSLNVDARWEPWAEIVEQLEAARNPNLVELDRLEIAVIIFDLLMQGSDAVGNQLQPGELMNAKPQAGDDEMDAMAAELMAALAGALGELIAGFAAEEMAERAAGRGGHPSAPKSEAQADENPDVAQNEAAEATSHNLSIPGLKSIAAELASSMVRALGEVKMERGEGRFDRTKLPTVKAIDILEGKSRRSAHVIEPAVEFTRLGQHLRYLRTENRTPGAPKTSGTRLVKQRLARMATDQKVMADLDSRQMSKGKPEVIILLDISGSTESGYGSKNGESLCESMTKGAFGAYESLKRAQVAVAVYAHTSTDRGSETQPLVYGVAAYQMPLLTPRLGSSGQVALRFATLLSVEHSQNFDGIALEFVLNQFTKKPGSKTVIVMSDGLPSGSYHYGGRLGREHTHDVAELARRQGKNVISMSLVQNVVKDNNEIYGEKFNLPAYGDRLDKALQNLVLTLGQGR